MFLLLLNIFLLAILSATRGEFSVYFFGLINNTGYFFLFFLFWLLSILLAKIFMEFEGGRERELLALECLFVSLSLSFSACRLFHYSTFNVKVKFHFECVFFVLFSCFCIMLCSLSLPTALCRKALPVLQLINNSNKSNNNNNNNEEH